CPGRFRLWGREVEPGEARCFRGRRGQHGDRFRPQVSAAGRAVAFDGHGSRCCGPLRDTREANMTNAKGVAVVTGAGSGLGQAIARRLAADGFAIGAIDIDEAAARGTARAIETAGGRAHAHRADTSQAAQLDAAIAALGPLEVMVNNAGVLDGYFDVDEMDEALWRRVIAIDLTGVFLGAKRALAEMLPRGRGRIVNMASVAGLNGTGGGAAYVA